MPPMVAKHMARVLKIKKAAKAGCFNNTGVRSPLNPPGMVKTAAKATVATRIDAVENAVVSSLLSWLSASLG
ncbi:hypothetical protein AAC387_Pa02g0203 [Persea americana]